VFQKSKQLIKQITASKWIETEGLNYIIVCLYNISVFLYKNGQLKKVFHSPFFVQIFHLMIIYHTYLLLEMFPQGINVLLVMDLKTNIVTEALSLDGSFYKRILESYLIHHD